MTRTNITYPRSTGTLTCIGNDPRQVSEEGADYGKTLTARLVDTTDFINDRLAKAEAVARLMERAKRYEEDAIKGASSVIVDLVQEARQATRKQWEEIQRYTRRQRRQQ